MPGFRTSASDETRDNPMINMGWALKPVTFR